MKRLSSISILFAMTSVAFPSYGQQSDLSVLEESLKQLKDPDWKNRSVAFERLMGLVHEPGVTRDALSVLLRRWPEKSDEIVLAVIKLLEKENQVEKARLDFFLREYKGPNFPHPFPDAAERDSYYSYLVDAVRGLKDPRSVNALVGAINTGNTVTSALAELGDAALDRVLEVFNNGDEVSRHSACGVLSGMLDAKNASKVSDHVSRQKIKDALIRAAGDQSGLMRLGGVEGLAKLKDPDVIPLIRNLSMNDPFKPVREAANEALKELGLNTHFSEPSSGLR